MTNSIDFMNLLGLGSFPPVLAWGIFGLLLIWSIYWKGMALWKSAHKNDTIWFVVMLIVNTVGILEILYIYFFSKKTEKQQS